MADAPLLNQNIFTLLGLNDLPEERKAALLEKMTELVQKRLALRLLESLSEPDAKAFEQLMSTHEGGDPALMDFFRSRFSNLEEILKEEIVGLKQDLTHVAAV